MVTLVVVSQIDTDRSDALLGGREGSDQSDIRKR